jgi:hypothetical protein
MRRRSRQEFKFMSLALINIEALQPAICQIAGIPVIRIKKNECADGILMFFCARLVNPVKELE